VVPSAAATVSSRPSPSSMRVTRVNRRVATMSRREFRRSSARVSVRSRDRLRDGTLSICRGC
jgi:hypothetical protein